MMGKQPSVSLQEVVGGGYTAFWRSEARYRVVKGSRASKKSKTAALNFIVRLMQHKESNLLVVRKTFRTLKDSCFAELKWACTRLGVAHLWDFRESPLEATYRPTGQKIFFRGLDDPLKVTSITTSTGYLCFLWVEEAYEITSEEAFDTLDESIRGTMPDGLFKQVTLTMNPWNERHWIKKRFFDAPTDDVFAATTTYHCNEWIDAADIALFERMKLQNPRRYKVAGMGEWGITEGLVYENWREGRVDVHAMLAENPKLDVAYGLDFGFTHPSAFVGVLIDEAAKEMYIFDELYQAGLTNIKLAELIKAKGYAKEHIIADSASSGAIQELRDLGISRIKPASKTKGSVLQGIQYIQNYEIIVDPKCENILFELSNYSWAKDKFGNRLEVPVKDFDHGLDALRYATEFARRGPIFSFD